MPSRQYGASARLSCLLTVRPGLYLTLALALLAGCWPLPQDDAGQPQPTAILAGTPLPGTPGVVLPSNGLPASTQGAVNMAIGEGEPPTLDPALAMDPYSLSIIRQLFSGLVTFNADLKVVPDVASAMPSVSADGKTYTFPLRRGVLFTNGQEVTSADFKYSIERAADPRLAGPYPATGLPAAVYLGDIVGVKEKLAGTAKEIAGVAAPDPYTLVITLDAPKPYFLQKLAAGPYFVVQRANVESGALWWEEPRGTGPYKLQRWERHQYMTLARNPEYYGGAPDVSIINILISPGGNDNASLYGKAGGLDVARVGVEQIEQVSDRNNPVSRELHVTPGSSLTYLGFNTRQRPFDDPKVREAIARSLDRQRLARSMFQSRVEQAEGFVLPGVEGYKPPQEEQLYNVSRARQLLAESAYKGAANIPRLRLFTGGDLVGTGEWLSQTLSETLGLDITVHEVEWRDYEAGLGRGEYGMFLATFSAPYPDPEATLGAMFRPNSPTNYTRYSNDEVDALLAAALTEGDVGKRLQGYAQAEARIIADYPAVPLYRSIGYTLVSPSLKGLTVTPMGLLSLRGMKVVGR